MADVGVRELKQHLSEYLDRAERGEVVTVTDRGRPKALLVPLPERGPLDQGVAEGWITAARRAGGLTPVTRRKARMSTAEALAEDRGP